MGGPGKGQYGRCDTSTGFLCTLPDSVALKDQILVPPCFWVDVRKGLNILLYVGHYLEKS